MERNRPSNLWPCSKFLCAPGTGSPLPALSAALLAGLLLIPAPPRACTTFCLADAPVFAKNYDWGVDDGLVVVNRSGVAKQAFGQEPPFTWRSRYGSLTFNQYGREFPSGGMNERGLVVELMWLEETEYPPVDARGALPILQWIQYQLDCSATVDDVVASDRKVRVVPGTAKIHFLIADESGAVAAVEYLSGRMVVHRGDDLPYRALANDTYERSAQYARGFDSDPARLTRSSLDRFTRAARAAQAGTSAADPVATAFGVLAEVAQGEYTQWSIVYDIRARVVHFRTRRNPEIRRIRMSDLGFDCASPVLVLDMNAPLSGDVTGRLDRYTPEANRSLVGASFSKTDFLRHVPAARLDELARFPGATYCTP